MPVVNRNQPKTRIQPKAIPVPNQITRGQAKKIIREQRTDLQQLNQLQTDPHAKKLIQQLLNSNLILLTSLNDAPDIT